jgi:FkbM family methyltransferase
MNVRQFLAEKSPTLYGFAREIRREHKYSQFGEDEWILRNLISNQISKWNYIDIGSAHPVIGSNTYLMYRQGAWGYTIDANPYLVNKHRKLRPRDIQIEAAVGSSEANIYFDINKNWSFSRKAYGIFHGEEVRRIYAKQIAFQSLLEQVSFEKHWLLNLDVEGSEIEILSSANFEEKRPTIALIEITKESSSAIEKIMQSWHFSSMKTLGMTRVYVDENLLR